MSKPKTPSLLLAAALVSAIGIFAVASVVMPNVLYLIQNPTDEVYVAVMRRDTQTLKRFVAEGRELNVLVGETTNPLFHALLENDWQSSKLLLDNGASLDVKARWQGSKSSKSMIDHLRDESRDNRNRLQLKIKAALVWLDSQGYLKG